MSENKMFSELLEEKKRMKSLLTNTAFWIGLFLVVVAAGLVVFLMSDVSEHWSPKEVEQSIQVVELDSQWVDKELTGYDVKIVPSFTFKLINKGKKPLKHMNMVAVFKFKQSEEVLGEGNAAIVKLPLLPGKESGEMIVKSPFGYSARSKQSFKRGFKDWQPVKVSILGKVSEGFAKLGTFDIKQTIAGIDQVGGQTEELDEKTMAAMTSLQVSLQGSKWLDKLVTDDRAVIVPSVTLKLKNVGGEKLGRGFVKGIFEFEDDGVVMGEGFVEVFKQSLDPGQTSGDIVLKADWGSYSAKDKADFIKQRLDWKRVKVRVFYKSMESDYALLGTYPVKQEVEGVKVVMK